MATGRLFGNISLGTFGSFASNPTSRYEASIKGGLSGSASSSITETRALFAGVIGPNIRAFLGTAAGFHGPGIYTLEQLNEGNIKPVSYTYAKSWLHTAAAFERDFISDSADLGASIDVEGPPYKDLPASLQPQYTEDLAALLTSVAGFDLPAAIEAVGSVDLPATMESIPSVDLGATGGGHFPEDISASMSITQPENLTAYIRQGFEGTKDLSAQIQQIGQVEDLGAFLRQTTAGEKDLGVKILPKRPIDLFADIHGFEKYDLSASLITQRIRDMYAIVWGWAREVEKDLPAWLRITTEGTKDLPVSGFKAVKSTHTSDKVPNLDRVAKSFFNNQYLFGTHGAGIFKLTLEPIFGYFPDLHAEINALRFLNDDITAFIRVADPGNLDLGSQITSVTSAVNINKVSLTFRPAVDLEASLTQVGAFNRLRAAIVPVHHAQTGTADDARFVTTATSYRFLLGTTGGVFIPPNQLPVLKVTTWRNDFSLPDLHATIQGWGEYNLTASIAIQPFIELAASLSALDIDHLSDFSAYLVPNHVKDIAASLTPGGFFEGLAASITSTGEIEDLPASLLAIISPLAHTVVPVSTQPFRDIGALINYDSLVKCAPSSAIKDLAASLRPLVGGTTETMTDLPASLNSLRLIDDLSADITGRKRTRIRVLTLNFRAAARDSDSIIGIVTPLRKVEIDLLASVSGLSHEFDLPSSITPVRYLQDDVRFVGSESLVDIEGGADIKTVLITFRSQVSSYVYEQVSSSVYVTDKGTWAIDLTSLVEDTSFFDLSGDTRSFKLDDVSEYYSIDEAIRAALVILCERRQANLSASLTAGGAFKDLPVSMEVTAIDQFSDVKGAIVSVLNSPDLSASINTGNQSSGIKALTSLITPITNTEENLLASVTGNIINDLSASVTAT